MRLTKKKLLATLLAGLSINALAADPACPECFDKRWIYFGGDLTRADHMAALRKIIPIAAAEGFNGIALNSAGNGGYSTLVKPNSYTPTLVTNIAELQRLGNDNGVEMIPVGGLPSVPVTLDSTLVEALPATTAFKVSDSGLFATIADNSNLIENSKFLTTAGWTMDSNWVKLDPNEGHTTETDQTLGSIKLVPSNGYPLNSEDKLNPNSRLWKSFNLQPHRAYRLSYWLKGGVGYDTTPLFIQILDTDVLVNEKKYVPLYRNGLGWGTDGNGNWNALSNSELFAKYTKDDRNWHRYELMFNTGNSANVTIYFANQTVGDTNTAAWIDDIELREIGLSQQVKRDSVAPVVTGGDGTVYTAGKDYVVDSPREQLTIPTGSRIRPKADLTVKWYQSGVNMFSRYGTPATACGDAYFDKQKLLNAKIAETFGGKFEKAETNKYFLYYDEIRLMNWDPRCSNQSAGTYLAHTVNRAGRDVSAIESADGKPWEKLTWNDMFDKKMNAIPRYWQVNGDLSTSTEALDSDFIIVNWAGGGGTGTNDDAVRRASLTQFAEAQHKQVIALYYDNLDSVKNWLNVVTGFKGPIDGFMYTTWVSVKGADGKEDKMYGYRHLTDVAKMMRAKYPKRWPAKVE